MKPVSAGSVDTTLSRFSRRLLPWLDRDALFLAAIAAMSVFFLSRAYLHLNQDGWVALVAGREVAEDGIPQHDALTVWSQGERWIDQQWLAQLVMYGSEAAAGPAAVVILHLALAMGAFGLAILAAQSLGARREHVVWVLPAAGFLYLAVASEVRTQGFAFPLFVAVLWLLASDPDAARRRTLLVLPALALWANLHGTVVLGVAATGLYGLIRVISGWPDRALARRGLPYVLGAPLMLLLTPYHVDGIAYYLDTVFNSEFRGVISEWQPITSEPVFSVPFFGLAFVTAWVLGRARGRATAFDHLALLLFATAGINAVRNAAWFALAVVVLLPPLLTASVRERPPAETKRSLNITLAGISVAALLIAVVVVAAKPRSWFEQRYDRRGLEVVAQATERDPSLKVFAEGRYADWMLWHERGLEGRIAYDARLELLSGEELNELSHLATVSSQDFTDALDGFGMIVLDPRDQPNAARAVLQEPGFEEVFRGDDVIVATQR